MVNQPCAVLVDGDDVGIVQPMRELEFSSQPGGLILASVVLVENLQRHKTIRIAAVCARYTVAYPPRPRVMSTTYPSNSSPTGSTIPA